MSRTKYQKEADNERSHLKRYAKLGFNTMRSAGSHGAVDGFVWDKERGIFICSRNTIRSEVTTIWPEEDRIEYLKKIPLFPNTCIVFIEKLPSGIKTYIYKYGEFNL